MKCEVWSHGERLVAFVAVVRGCFQPIGVGLKALDDAWRTVLAHFWGVNAAVNGVDSVRLGIAARRHGICCRRIGSERKGCMFVLGIYKYQRDMIFYKVVSSVVLLILSVISRIEG